MSIIVLLACCFAAVGASKDFIGHFVDMVLVLLVVLVPWTAINLIDFYAIHKGKYDIQSIFRSTAASTAATTRRRCWPTRSASRCRSRS
jgi:purine-cytosine permease-like protein